MDVQKRLFQWGELYNHSDTNEIFLQSVKKNVLFHIRHCKEYRAILKSRRFKTEKLTDIDDLHKLPPIPTLYLKNHKLASMSQKKMLIKSTSSGTSGKRSFVGFDIRDLFLGFLMVRKVANFHKLISYKPTNYIVLGYQPSKYNQAIIAKTALGATFLAPAIHREYALRWENGKYTLELERLKKTIGMYGKQPFPVRLIGFPSYLYFFLMELKKSGMKVKLKKDSKVFLGGGWKELDDVKVDKKILYDLLFDVLGIPEENCIEFFGVAEHPIIYCQCKNHHFHVPSYSRVIIRDVTSLEPVKNGEVGLLNLITPMVNSIPLVSIMTDDLAVLHNGEECGCGIKTPYFELIGRVGLQDIKTCAANAAKHIQV